MDWANRFSLSRLIVSYTMLLQMWEVITERDGIEVSYSWFPTKKKAEPSAMNKLARAVDANTKAFEKNREAVAEMLSLLKTKVIQ